MTRSVSRSVVVKASADQIFALLTDPRRHSDFDGSDTVKGQVTGPDRLVAGSRFGMKMHKGMPYTITNEVVEFQDNALVGWRNLGRHIWRYELAAEGDGTKVTETFDWATSRAPFVLELLKLPEKSAVSIEKTLQRLKVLLEKA